MNILIENNSEYINKFNEICKKIKHYSFSNYSDALYFVIEDYEDSYHNNLAAYNLVKMLNSDFSRSNIEAKISTSSNIIVIRKTRRKSSLFNKLCSYITKNS